MLFDTQARTDVCRLNLFKETRDTPNMLRDKNNEHM